MFIDVEGISGSGKTALVERVAARLGRLGHRVHCPATAPLEVKGLHPRAWLLLELSRQLQLREEAIRPALRRGELCLTESSLPGHWAVAQAGLGLAPGALSSAFGLAEAGLQPDLVVLLDVDPELARWRRIAAGRPGNGPWSRGVEARARRELLAMAWRDPARWLVVENEGRSPKLVEERIVNAVLSRLGRDPGQVEPLLPPAPPPPFARVPEELEGAFFRALDRLEPREPEVGVLLLAGVGGPTAMRRRLRALERWPKEVALGLTGLVEPEALRLRELLAELSPREVAKSLTGAGGPSVDALRDRLFERAPGEVVATLTGDDRGYAWCLREQALSRGLEHPVLRGLAGVDGARAWRVRRAASAQGGLEAPLAESLGGLSGPEAEAMREALFAKAPRQVVRSTHGVGSRAALGLRERLLEWAPGLVLRSLAGVDTPEAHAMRERAAPACPEALESVAGLDSEEAWRLRLRHVGTWPAAAVGSLGALARSPRGREVLTQALFHAGDRLGVLRRGLAAWLRSPPPGRVPLERGREQWKAPAGPAHSSPQ